MNAHTFNQQGERHQQALSASQVKTRKGIMKELEGSLFPRILEHKPKMTFLYCGAQEKMPSKTTCTVKTSMKSKDMMTDTGRTR